jgi:two-component system sensor histidine kinase DegS
MSLKKVRIGSRAYERLGDEQLREREKLVTRAQTLAYARLVILAIGMGLLAMPNLALDMGLVTKQVLVWYLIIIAYTALHVILMRHRRWGPAVTAVTMVADLIAISWLIFASGGLDSPMVGLLLIHTTVIALVFPSGLVMAAPLLTVGGIALAEWLSGISPEVLSFQLGWYAGLNLMVVAIVVHISQREGEQTREILALEGHLKKNAVVDERNRLAREMHDGIGAALSGLVIQAEYLKSMLDDGEARQEAEELYELAQTAIEELRRSLKMMRSDFELLPALLEYCRGAAGRYRVAIDPDLMEPPPGIPSEQQLAIFRVLQECLSNAVKHGAAKRISVQLSFRDNKLTLEVEDDGKGFNPTLDKHGHYGLINMRERATRWGGGFTIESAPGSGCRVIFSVPFTPPNLELPDEIYEASQIRLARLD